MPRNQSEQLPRCPEAHVYADNLEARLAGLPYKGTLHLWRQIPSEVKATILAAGPAGIGEWSTLRIAHIRETYAP